MRLSKARLNRGATEELNSKRAVQFFFCKISGKSGKNTGKIRVQEKKYTFFEKFSSKVLVIKKNVVILLQINQSDGADSPKN